MYHRLTLKIIFILLLSLSAYADSDCTEADKINTIHRDSHTFVTNWESCGLSSWGVAATFGKCITEKHPDTTSACINCFSQFVGCTRSNCWFKCMFFSTACENCAIKNCEPKLVTCTGVDKANLPSKHKNNR